MLWYYGSVVFFSFQTNLKENKLFTIYCSDGSILLTRWLFSKYGFLTNNIANNMKLNVFLIIFFLDDHSRVILQNTDNDYINASLVVNEEAQRSYILTQVIIRC